MDPKKIVIFIVLAIVLIIILLLVLRNIKSSAAPTVIGPNQALLGTYKDPNNPNNLVVIYEGGNYYIVEVNGTRHLMQVNGNTVSVQDWKQTWTFTGKALGPLTKL